MWPHRAEPCVALNLRPVFSSALPLPDSTGDIAASQIKAALQAGAGSPRTHALSGMWRRCNQIPGSNAQRPYTQGLEKENPIRAIWFPQACKVALAEKPRPDPGGCPVGRPGTHTSSLTGWAEVPASVSGCLSLAAAKHTKWQTCHQAPGHFSVQNAEA